MTGTEAAKLKDELTPMGGQRAGNADGSIPAWTGGQTEPVAGFKNGGRRPDPFAADKPLYSVNAQNIERYADKLTDGTKAMLKRYPQSYRIDVYPSRRTAAAPQWVYDNTFKNATSAKLVAGTAGPMVEGAYAGIPFPIPKSGAEVMWNHRMRWRGEAFRWDVNQYQVSADGRRVLVNNGAGDNQIPYYFRSQSADKWNGDLMHVRIVNAGPPIRAGEALLARINANDEKTEAWVYLVGQRRVRKLPNPCCDTPAPQTAGIMTFDEMEGFTGRMDRYEWKLLGKKEMLIPYNSNRTLLPTKDEDVVGANHLSPDHVRWELHRVWEVEATLANGKRHPSARSIFYVDEDSWHVVLADRWDAQGQLARTIWQIPYVMPDVPAVTTVTFGMYDLLAGTWYANGIFNSKSEQYRVMSPYPEGTFSPDALAGQSLR
ncbi:MAG: DUF1329 domain-containing protein [Pigmentiphaga sp.]|uniref:DUF1329 domain-containing protein n=1 Tax=Pigmentiphaga sp. TaxID=1977564 RepID=UPI003B56251F